MGASQLAHVVRLACCRAPLRRSRLDLLVSPFPLATRISAPDAQIISRTTRACPSSLSLSSERLPEALFPDSGLFDLVGHSHMWFHLLAVAAVLAQYGGATEGFRAVHGIDGRAAAVCIKSG